MKTSLFSRIERLIELSDYTEKEKKGIRMGTAISAGMGAVVGGSITRPSPYRHRLSGGGNPFGPPGGVSMDRARHPEDYWWKGDEKPKKKGPKPPRRNRTMFGKGAPDLRGMDRAKFIKNELSGRAGALKKSAIKGAKKHPVAVGATIGAGLLGWRGNIAAKKAVQTQREETIKREQRKAAKLAKAQ